MIPNDRFQKFYQREVQDYVDTLNSRRRVLAPLAVLSIIISFLPTVIMFYIMFNTRIMVDGHLIIRMIMPLVAVLLMLICPLSAYILVTENYRKSYKDGIIAKVLLEFTDFCEYDHHRGLPQTFFHSTLLFSHYPAPNFYLSKDLFALEKEGNSVIFSEVYATCGYKTSKRIIFEGLLGFIPVGTNFMSPLVIRSRKLDDNATFGSMLTPTFESKVNRYGGLKKIKFNDEKFDSSFNVFAAKHKSAKKILNSDIRNGIMKLKQEIQSDLHFSFFNGLLYIAIPFDRNLFEPPLFSPIDKNLIQQEFKLIQTMFNLIELLKIKVKEEEKKPVKELLEIINHFHNI